LSKDLLGGPESLIDLRTLIESSPHIGVYDGFVCLRGHEALIGKSRPRVTENGLRNGEATAIAVDFARSLLRACPLVDCVALSGSVATGGYVPTDDVDLDIFVWDHAKYLTYALALALGFLVSLRSRKGGRLRKVVCINVIWTRSQAEPFARNDEALAFELLHCRPIFGALHFRQVITSNPWLLLFFPQLGSVNPTDRTPPDVSPIGRIVRWVGSHLVLLTLADRVGRLLSHAVYEFAHWFKRNDLEAMERLAFLREVKFPYEVFQD